MTCSVTRLILLAWAVGLLVASVSGSDTVGWLTAGVAVAIAATIDRWGPSRFGSSTCAVPRRAVEAEAEVATEPESAVH